MPFAGDASASPTGRRLLVPVLLLALTVPVGCAAPGTAPAPAPARSAAPASDLEGLVVAPDGPPTGYDRVGGFGTWLPTGSGCDTRDTVLARDLTAPTVRHGCDVVAGTLHSPYTGATVTGPSRTVQIDHRVPLSLAWRTGAATWTRARRVAFANDPLELVAVEGAANESKGDSGPEAWAPPADRCGYARGFVAVLVKYHLAVTAARKAALTRMMATCPAP